MFQKKKKQHGSDSEHSYYSEVSAGGTRRTMRSKRIRDKDGKVIGHAKAEHYESKSRDDGLPQWSQRWTGDPTVEGSNPVRRARKTLRFSESKRLC